MDKDYALKLPRTGMDYWRIYQSWTGPPETCVTVGEDEGNTKKFVPYAVSTILRRAKDRMNTIGDSMD
jgi:hypothetical protein